MKKIICTAFIATLALTLFGCEKGIAPSSESITIFNKDKIQNSPSFKMTEEFLLKTGFIKKYSAEKKCYEIRILDGADTDYYCVNLVNTVDKNNLIYATVAGDKEAKDGTPMNSHLNQGILKFFILKNDAGNFSTISQGDFEDSGVYGAASSEIKTVTINSDGNLAWTVSEGDMRQGYITDGVTLFIQNGKKITEALKIPTLSDNSGACNDENSCEINIVSANIQVNSKVSGYFPLTAEVSIKKTLKKKDIENTVKKFVIPFDDKSMKYVAPKEYYAFFSN